MRSIFKIFSIAVVSLWAVSSANADILTTLFDGGSGGSPGGAVYFDATVGSNTITVTAFTTNLGEDLLFSDFGVFVLSGQTSQGNETNAGAPWVQVATGSGTGAGQNIPTNITLSNTFDLTPGLHGLALVAGTGTAHDYTQGDGNNQNYSDANLSLSLGTASNMPFTGSVFNPRVWNGSITYDVAAIPEPTSLAVLGLAAIGLIVRRRRS